MGIAVHNITLQWELVCHSVTCHPTEVTFPLLLQLKLVYDLATMEALH